MTDSKGNSGYWNSGNWNSGNCNSGDRNSGYWNSGDRNSGYWNSGDRNSGYWNSGDWNSGYWNSGDWNSGYFCTETPSPIIFDAPCEMDRNDLLTAIYNAVPDIMLNEWVRSEDMNADEKQANPSHTTRGGYLRSYKTVQEAGAAAWSALTPEKRAEHDRLIRTLPNFDEAKFLACTGIDLSNGKEPSPDNKPREIVIDGVRYVRVADGKPEGGAS